MCIRDSLGLDSRRPRAARQLRGSAGSRLMAGEHTMGQGFGMEVPSGSSHEPEQPPARYLVVIDSATEASRQAKLFLETRAEVAQFDAGAPEVQMMTRGLAPQHGAAGPEWDTALGGHDATERAAAEIYTLDP